MQSIWNCSLDLGPTVIPVKVYSGTEKHQLEFSQIDVRDKAKIKISRYNESTGEIVANEHLGKAYAHESGLVHIPVNFMDSVMSGKDNTLDFKHFCPVSSVEAVYFENFYYLLPDKKAEVSYSVVRDYLEKYNLYGVCNGRFRHLAQLFLLSHYQDKLILHRIKYHHQLVDCESPAPIAPNLQNVQLRSDVVSHLNFSIGAFNPRSYKDHVTDAFHTKLQAHLQQAS